MYHESNSKSSEWSPKKSPSKKVFISDDVKKMTYSYAGNEEKIEHKSTETLKTYGAHPYVISVYTSNVPNAGTDAGIYLQLFGEYDSPGITMHGPSDNNSKAFQTGQEDIFKISSSKYLGYIDRIKIACDGKTKSPEWLLDKIVICDGNKKKFTFTVNNWLFLNLSEHILKADGAHQYNISIYTSKMKDAGTDATIYLQLYGEYGTEEIKMSGASLNNVKAFQTGQKDTYTISCSRYLGHIDMIKVSCDDKRQWSEWHLNKIVINDESKEKDFIFSVNRWLFQYQTQHILRNDNGKLSSETSSPVKETGFNGKEASTMGGPEIEAPVTATSLVSLEAESDGFNDAPSPDNLPDLGTQQYTVLIYTSGIKNAGTDVPIYLQLYGENGKEEIKIYDTSENNTKALQTGQIDVFTVVTSKDLGHIHEIKVGYDGNHNSPHWHLNKIIVCDGEKKKNFVFECNQWLFLNQDYHILKNSDGIGMKLPIIPLGDKKDHFNVNHDGEETYPKGSSVNSLGKGPSPDDLGVLPLGKEKHPNELAEYPLRKSKSLNDSEVFHLEKVPDDSEVFPLRKATSVDDSTDVHHYTASVFSSKLINSSVANNIYLTLCGSKYYKEFKIHGPDGDIKKSAQDGQKDVFEFTSKYLGHIDAIKLQHDAKEKASPWYLNKIVVNDKDTSDKYEFPYNDWLFKNQRAHEIHNDDDDFKGSTSNLLPDNDFRGSSSNLLPVEILKKPKSPNVLSDGRRYTASILTANLLWAEIDSIFYLTLIGLKGSKLFKLKTEDDNEGFEQGRNDIFALTSSDLGDIHMIKVRHDCSRRQPAWHLIKVIVKDEATKRDYVFNTNKWINHKAESVFKPEGYAMDGIDPMIRENSLAHHTEKFKMRKSPQSLILRRGQTFLFSLNVPMNYSEKPFYISFKTGLHLQEQNKTMVKVKDHTPEEFEILKNGKHIWGFKKHQSKGLNSLLVEVYIPPTAIPGKYKMKVENTNGVILEYKPPVYILFNPWCSGDDVFMDDDNSIKEYVLKQNGILYLGSARDPQPKKWYYGQFEEISLDVAFKLLEEGAIVGRDTAAEVSRILCSKINSENGGILAGNWTGDYANGTPPSAWSSTPSIFEAYMKELKAVRWGHCWVFSAVLNTVLRTVGIPCRSVTNFITAHDADGSCSDKITIGDDGHVLVGESNGCMWSFHCWNDAWMLRNDLKPGYGGWQVLNAAPHNRSRDLPSIGPASLKAIREGEFSYPYGTKVMITEINAEITHKKEKKKDDIEVIYSDRKFVGNDIITKAVNMDGFEDLTTTYKFESGSVFDLPLVNESRAKVNRNTGKPLREDVKVAIMPQKSTFYTGEDIGVKVLLGNSYREDLKANITFGGDVVRYNGDVKINLRKHKEAVTLEANEYVMVLLVVTAGQYMPHLEDDTLVKFSAAVTVPISNQVARTEELIYINKPKLEVALLSQEFISSATYMFKVSFTNPLDCSLTNCKIMIDGSFVAERIVLTDINDIPAKTMFKEVIKISPDYITRIGKTNDVSKKSINVSFSCKELGGFSEAIKVNIKGNSDSHKMNYVDYAFAKGDKTLQK